MRLDHPDCNSTLKTWYPLEEKKCTWKSFFLSSATNTNGGRLNKETNEKTIRKVYRVFTEVLPKNSLSPLMSLACCNPSDWVHVQPIKTVWIVSLESFLGVSEKKGPSEWFIMISNTQWQCEGRNMSSSDTPISIWVWVTYRYILVGYSHPFTSYFGVH